MLSLYGASNLKPVPYICTGFLLFILLFLSGCSGVSLSERQRSAVRVVDQPDHHDRLPVSRPQTAGVKAALYAQHDVWAGTPYQLGGLDRNGIDCSGFVYTTFRRKFNHKLPRTVSSQARLGQTVTLDRIQPGDLLFFRTGRARRHVGIYVEDGKFLHVSASEGVVLSSLDEPYWASNFWKAQRLTGLAANH